MQIYHVPFITAFRFAVSRSYFYFWSICAPFNTFKCNFFRRDQPTFCKVIINVYYVVVGCDLPCMYRFGASSKFENLTADSLQLSLYGFHYLSFLKCFTCQVASTDA
jgi:hypothetical protein